MIRVLDILEDYLYQMNMNFERLDGRIRGNDRQAAIDRFSKPGKSYFNISRSFFEPFLQIRIDLYFFCVPVQVVLVLT